MGFGKRNIISNLAVFGSTHALIDATSAAVVFAAMGIYGIGLEALFGFIVLYNVLAFSLQAVFGIVLDKYDIPRFGALIGCLLMASSVFVIGISLLPAIILAGLGNALFHVGGGSISLNLTPKRATAPGIYVAPGALGLAIGTVIGMGGYFIGWPFVLLLLLAGLAMYKIKVPKIDYKQQKPKGGLSSFELIVLLFFLVIVGRAIIGLSLVLPWKSDTALFFTLIMAIVLGKGIGGILSDRFGWRKVAVGAVVLSSPLLAFTSLIPYLAIIGAFLFNITMPVTLTGISNTLSGRPAFAFGLTCLALIIGAFPIFIGLKEIFSNGIFIFSVIILSAGMLYYGLGLHNKHILIHKTK